MRRLSGLAPGMVLAVFLAFCAFCISFDALRAVSLASGVNPWLSWMFPLIIDGSTLMFTWATWAFRTRAMRTWYPWMMLVMFSLFSLAGNALHAHAVPVDGVTLPSWAPAIVMTMPPVALLAATHMLVMAAADTYDRRLAEEAEETVPEPEPETPEETGEPAPEPVQPALEPEGDGPEETGEPAPEKTPEPEKEPAPSEPYDPFSERHWTALRPLPATGEA